MDKPDTNFNKVNEQAKKDRDNIIRVADYIMYKPLVLFPDCKINARDIPPGLTAGDAFIDTASMKDYWNLKERMAKQGRLREYRWVDEDEGD